MDIIIISPVTEDIGANTGIYTQYFNDVTNSIGVNINRSLIGNLTFFIFSVFLKLFFLYSGISEALTGPYITPKPVSFFTKCAAIPGAPSCGTICFS